MTHVEPHPEWLNGRFICSSQEIKLQSASAAVSRVISSCFSVVTTGCFLRRAEDIYVLMATKTGLLIPTVMVSNPNECFWCKTFPAVFPVWFEGLNVSAVIQVLSEASSCDFHLLLLLINHISSSRVQLPPGFLINHLHYETFITSTWQMRTVEDICHPAEPATAYRLLLFINSFHL